MLPSQEDTITQLIVEASRASAGLLVLSLTLSVIIGLSLRVEAARMGGALVSGRLYVTISRLASGESALVALGEWQP